MTKRDVVNAETTPTTDRTTSFGHASRPAGSRRDDGRADIEPLRIAIVNDYEIIVRGLDAMLEPFSDRIEVVELEVGGTPSHDVDIALFDTFAGRRDAIGRASRMVQERHARHVVLYTWDASDAFLAAAHDAEVSAVMLKSLAGAELVDALERVARGEYVASDSVSTGSELLGHEPLSHREREVLAMLALGYRNAEIADELFLSVDTVKTYVRRVFQKLGVNNRTQAALRAVDYGLAPPQTRLDRVTAERAPE